MSCYGGGFLLPPAFAGKVTKSVLSVWSYDRSIETNVQGLLLPPASAGKVTKSVCQYAHITIVNHIT